MARDRFIHRWLQATQAERGDDDAWSALPQSKNVEDRRAERPAMLSNVLIESEHRARMGATRGIGGSVLWPPRWSADPMARELGYLDIGRPAEGADSSYYPYSRHLAPEPMGR